MNSLIGKTLGPYRITEQIGRGGMAAVYKAYQPSLERYVAVKVLPAQLAGGPGFMKRFKREARAVAKLEHPHIVPVYDYGSDDDLTYIVMRYVEAGTLKDLVAQPLELGQIAELIGQIAEALDHAHEQGVVHRDVKPSNVLLDRGEWALLTDFGVARMVEAAQKITATGVGVGTPAYMSPEQGQGKRVDGRSDVYSLAVVWKHVNEPLPLPREISPDIPEAVERVVLKAMAKATGDRYGKAGELARGLWEAVRGAEAERLVPRVVGKAMTQDVIVEEPRRVRGLERLRRLWWVVPAVLLTAVGLGFLTRTPALTSAPAGPTVEEKIGGISAPAKQARVFADPILAAIADREPTWSDDFSDPGSGWPIGSTVDGDEWGYQDNTYFISATYRPPDGCCVGATPDRARWFSDFVLEVDAAFASGEWGSWYMMIRDLAGTLEQPVSAHYGVLFQPNGALNLYKNVAGVHMELVREPIYAPTFEQGFGANRLTIIAQGPQIAVYVNGEPLWFVYDESSSKGIISLGVNNPSNTTLRVHFDNLKVWDITDLPLPTPAP